MNDRIFIDTNVLFYSYSNNEPEKKAIACNLITENDTFISTQVLQELTNSVTRKLKFSFTQVSAAIRECCQNNNLHTVSLDTIFEACKIADRYKFSFFDSLIIASAIECGCTNLYTEDLSHKQVVSEKLEIINPFSGLK